MPSIAHLCNRSVTIKRMTRTSDGQGGYSEVPAAVPSLDPIRGRRSPASGSDRFLAGREEAIVTNIWYFDGSPDIRFKDLIVDGTTTYEVLASLPPSKPDHLKLQTREFQHG